MVVILVGMCPGVDTALWTTIRVKPGVTPVTGTRLVIHDHVIATNRSSVRTDQFKRFDPNGLSDEDSEPFVVGAAFSMVGV